MSNGYDIVEFCAHCNNETYYDDYDPEKKGYIVRCTECGAQICLCSACMCAPDNKDRYCDWYKVRETKNWYQGKCWRGTTFNRK